MGPYAMTEGEEVIEKCEMWIPCGQRAGGTDVLKNEIGPAGDV